MFDGRRNEGPDRPLMADLLRVHRHGTGEDGRRCLRSASSGVGRLTVATVQRARDNRLFEIGSARRGRGRVPSGNGRDSPRSSAGRLPDARIQAGRAVLQSRMDASLSSEARLFCSWPRVRSGPRQSLNRREARHSRWGLPPAFSRTVGLGYHRAGSVAARADFGRARWCWSHDAVEQGVEADEAKHIGASQLNSSVGRTYRGRAM